MQADLLKNRAEILDFLSKNNIPHEYYEHEAAMTIEDCLRLPFATEDVMFCKNIFLCNRQKTNFYLFVMKPSTPFRTAVVSKALGVSRLSFAPEESLPELLHLTSGSVSPLALMYDQEKRIVFGYEKAIRETEKIAFHPCDNSATVVFRQEDFWQKALPLLGVKGMEIDLSALMEE